MSAVKFQYIKDNGGGLHLAIFDNEKCIGFLSGFESSSKGSGKEDIAAIETWQEWDGRQDYAKSDQAAHDQLKSYEHGWTIIADNEGVYPDIMGATGKRYFGIED